MARGVKNCEFATLKLITTYSATKDQGTEKTGCFTTLDNCKTL